jgi:hypothetical protein
LVSCEKRVEGGEREVSRQSRTSTPPNVRQARSAKSGRFPLDVVGAREQAKRGGPGEACKLRQAEYEKTLLLQVVLLVWHPVRPRRGTGASVALPRDCREAAEPYRRQIRQNSSSRGHIEQQTRGSSVLQEAQGGTRAARAYCSRNGATRELTRVDWVRNWAEEEKWRLVCLSLILAAQLDCGCRPGCCSMAALHLQVIVVPVLEGKAPSPFDSLPLCLARSSPPVRLSLSLDLLACFRGW